MLTIRMDDKDSIIEITANGHADSRACAATSFMLQAFVQMLLDYNIRVYYQFEPGNSKIKVDKHAMGAYSVECFYHLGFVRRAFMMLAENEGENVRFDYNQGGESK